MDAIQRGAPPKDLQLLDGLPTQKGAKQAAKAENMVQMPMRQQHAGEVPETRARLKDLALRALTTIDQEAVFIVLDDQRREAALGRWRGGRCAEKEDLKQG